MKLYRIKFRHSIFSHLPKEEQAFFVRLAQVRNDLRQIDLICLTGVQSVNDTAESEKDVSLHQLMFGVRLLYGTLNEAWQIVQTGWNRSGLAKSFYPLLSTDSKEALDRLKKYFGSKNLISGIRNKFAFHYDPTIISEALLDIESKPPRNFEFVTGRTNANVFYGFAEIVRNFAMAKATGLTMGRDAVRKLYDEPHGVYTDFTLFSDGVLLIVAEKLSMTTKVVETKAITQMGKFPNVIFIEES